MKRRILDSQQVVYRPQDSRLPLPRERRRDSAGVGAAIAVSLLAGAVLMAMALGWVRL